MVRFVFDNAKKLLGCVTKEFDSYPIRGFFWMILLFRIGGTFFVQTSFVPDEYWQSTEVAHRHVFQYGYLTWEWREGIRSSVYPLIIAFQYKILSLLKLDTALTLTWIPRFVQAVMSSFGDYWTVLLANRLYGLSAMRWAVVAILTHWFSHYMASRTLTNVMEQSLTAGAMLFYPWPGGKVTATSWRYVWLVALNCAIRPTAALTFAPLLFHHVCLRPLAFIQRVVLFGRIVFTGVVALIMLLCCDRYFYGYWVFTPWNFFKLNAIQDIGAFYGTNPFHWYLTQGLPVVMSLHLFPVAVALLLAKSNRLLLFTCAFHIFTLSLLSHKEFRFLSPIVPALLCLAGAGLSKLSTKTAVIVALIMTVFFAPMAMYLGLVHQSGSLKMMRELNTRLANNTRPTTVFFATPCHSLPYHSHLHLAHVKLDFVSCEPNWNMEPDYKADTQQLLEDPANFIQSYMDSNARPDYIVFFNNIYKPLIDFISIYDYFYETGIFHAHLPQDGQGKEIWLYKLS